MATFDRLHPMLVHQVVNALGWRSLRPVQELAIAAAEAGGNLLILAPTAAGKTEAAFFPLISRALAETWDGPAVLYVSPIKALLKNQHERLERYYGPVGRRAAVWHGDVPAAAKRRLLEEPPDCLLTTPESLEGMLVSGSVRHDRLFAGIRGGPETGTHLVFTGGPRRSASVARPGRSDPPAGFAPEPIRSVSADLSPTGPRPAVGREGQADRAEQSRGRPKGSGAVPCLRLLTPLSSGGPHRPRSGPRRSRPAGPTDRGRRSSRSGGAVKR
jgi:hypothetical protein